MNEPRAQAQKVGRMRRHTSAVALLIGWGVVFFGLASAYSGFGLPFLLFSPVPFLVGAWLAPTKARISHAALIMVCWCIGLGFALA